MTFTNVRSEAMCQDIMGRVERPIARAGLRDDESRAMDILEDPIEFAQNIARTLEGGELQGVLINALPVTEDKQLRELQGLLEEVIQQRDWEAVTRISNKLNDKTNAAADAAHEYGVALGAVMEQLRTGLLDVVRLRNAGETEYQRRAAEDIAKLKARVTLQGQARAAG